MKHIFRILILAVILVTELTTVSAQTVTVNVRQKVRVLPTTATNYLDDPFRYFDITCNLVGADNLEVFFDIDYSLNDESFYIRTDPTKAPKEKLTLSAGINHMSKDDMLSQLRGRKKTNVDFSNPINSQLLPEGTYQLCIDVYLWIDKDNPERVPISLGPCSSYEVCYSGSAPELVSPLAGAQMALNGAMVLSPMRKINFLWTPVISNCNEKTPRFNYNLRVVKVLNGQNYQDAIKINPTIFATEVGNKTFAVLDTLRDVKVRLEKGALYVAQVEATLINASSRSMAFNIANDGKSQPMPFYWCSIPDGAGGLDNDIDGLDGLGGQGGYSLTQWEGGLEEVSQLDDILEEAIPDEGSIVLVPSRHYVESDGYYTIPMTNDIEVGLRFAQHEMMKNVSYSLDLYRYNGVDVEGTVGNKPLYSQKIEEVPEDSHELVTRTLTGWGNKLKQGNLYYLQLTTSFSAEYLKYAVADTTFYVNGVFAEHIHDTISYELVKDELESTDGVFFQWGDDAEAPAFTTPQWKAPVDRTGDDIYEPANYQLPALVPEVEMSGSFPVSWTRVKNVTKGDVVEYEVNVYELKPDQTLEEAVSSNEVLVTRTVTRVTEIFASDTEFFKVFSPMKTYVMTLSTTVSGDSDTVYHFENGNEAIPIVFKIRK